MNVKSFVCHVSAIAIGAPIAVFIYGMYDTWKTDASAPAPNRPAFGGIAHS